jgi:hypothetical protein
MHHVVPWREADSSPLGFAEIMDSFSWGRVFRFNLWGWTFLEEGVNFGEDVCGEN